MGLVFELRDAQAGLLFRYPGMASAPYLYDYELPYTGMYRIIISGNYATGPYRIHMRLESIRQTG